MYQPNSDDPTGIFPGPSHAEYVPPSEYEQEILSELEDYWHDAEQDAIERHSTVEFNKCMLQGDQLVVRRRYDNEVIRVIDESNLSGRLFSQDNVLRENAQAFVGKATRIISKPEVMPATTDREDLIAAEVRNSYCDYWFNENDMAVWNQRGWEQVVYAGMAPYELYWDKRAGVDLYWCETCDFWILEGEDGAPCPLCAMQNLEGVLAKVKSGACKSRLLAPDEFFPEPGVCEVADMKWYFTRRAVHLSDIRNDYPLTGHLVDEERDLYRDIYGSYRGDLSTTTVTTEFVRGYAQLDMFHCIPSAKYPEGRLIVRAGGRILEEGPHPLYSMLGRLPVYLLRGPRLPKTLGGEPLMTNANNLQKDYNHLITQLREHRELVGNPKMLVQTGSGVSGSRIDTTSGEIINYRRGHKEPKYLPVPNYPDWAAGEKEYFKGAIRGKFFLTEHDLGQNTGEASGRQIALLAAQSSELMGPLMLENNVEWLKMFRGVLTVSEELDHPEVRWMATGQDVMTQHSWSQLSSKKAFHVRMADEDALSKNPTIRLEQAQNLLQLGAYNDDPTNPGLPNQRRFQADAGLKTPEAGLDSQKAEHTYAQSIPDRIAQGLPVQPKLWDDALIFAGELALWLRTKGRTAEEWLANEVQKLWLYYAQAARQPTPRAMSHMPSPGMMQQGPPGQGGQQQQGGAPRPQGQQPPQAQQGQQPKPPGSREAPGQLVRRADQTGERLARGNRPHEG